MATAMIRVDGKDYKKSECAINPKTGKYEHVGKKAAADAAAEAGGTAEEAGEEAAPAKKATKK